jgi:hypothetical protein
MNRELVRIRRWWPFLIWRYHPLFILRDRKTAKNFTNVYTLGYAEIPKVFLTSHHGRWHQKGNQENNKCNNSIKGNNIIRSHCCNVIKGHCLNNVSQHGPGSHCCNNVFQQWPRITLLPQCAPTTILGHGGCVVPRKKRDWRAQQYDTVFFGHDKAWRTPKNRSE